MSPANSSKAGTRTIGLSFAPSTSRRVLCSLPLASDARKSWASERRVEPAQWQVALRREVFRTLAHVVLGRDVLSGDLLTRGRARAGRVLECTPANLRRRYRGSPSAWSGKL